MLGLREGLQVKSNTSFISVPFGDGGNPSTSVEVHSAKWSVRFPKVRLTLPLKLKRTDHEHVDTNHRSRHSGQVRRDPESRKPWIPASAGMTSKGNQPEVDFESTHYFKPLAFKERVV